MENLKESMRKAIHLMFSNWTGLEIAVRESGNRNSAVILIRLLDTIFDIIWSGITRNGGFDSDVMIDLLASTLYHQFDTICEDNSAEEIVGLMNKMSQCILNGEDPLQLPEIKGLRQSEKWVMERQPALALPRATVAAVAGPAVESRDIAEASGGRNGNWPFFAPDVTSQLVALGVADEVSILGDDSFEEYKTSTVEGVIDESDDVIEEQAVASDGGEIEDGEEDDTTDDDSSAFVGAGEGAGRVSAVHARRAEVDGAPEAEEDAEAEPGLRIGAGEAIVADPSDHEEEASNDGEGFHPVTPVSSSSEEESEDDAAGEEEAQGAKESQKATVGVGAEKEGASATPDEMAKLAMEMNVIFMRNIPMKRKKRTYHRYTPTVMDQSLASVSGLSDIATASFSGAAGTSASFEAPDEAQGMIGANDNEAPDGAPANEALEPGAEGNNDQEARDGSGWEDVKTRKRK